MLRALILGFLIACVSAPVRGQVCSGDLTLSSQAEVNAFACSEIEGDFRISGADITDLTPLSILTLLDGSLTIDDNGVLPSLAGLENLAYIEGRDITIDDNEALTSIAALGGLTTIDLSGLLVRGNASLTSLVGLEALTQADRCFINDNDALVSMTGLDGLTSVGRLFVLRNTSLASLSGLDNLVTAGWHVRIEDNAGLTSLEGLGSLTSIGFGLFSPGDLRIIGNASLASLDGLESLTSVGQDVLITDNASLVSLAGLASLDYVEEELHITNNDALETLAGLEALSSVVIALRVSGNDALDACSCGLSGIISGDPPEFTGALGQVSITSNRAGGSCTAPSVVLVNPCTPQGPFDLVAQVADLDPTVNPGEAISFVYTVTNTTASPVSGDLWFTASPGGSSGLIRSGAVQPGQRISGSYTQNVPATTLPGSYDYTLAIGQFPDILQDSVQFTLTVTNSARSSGVAEAWSVAGATPWGVEPSVEASSSSLPVAFALEAPYPNPFASATTVAFMLPEASDVRLTVHDVLGREVAVLMNGDAAAGRHTARFETSGLAGGVYLVRLGAGDFAAVQRVTLAR